MSVYIDTLNIYQYRGISSLTINGFKDINLIVGNNNSGKTSLLETLTLLSEPYSVQNVFTTARLRELSYRWSIPMNTVYDCFLNIFPKGSTHLSVQAAGPLGTVSVGIIGSEQSAVIEEDDLRSLPLSAKYSRKSWVGTEVPAFVGKLTGSINGEYKEIPLKIASFSRSLPYRNLYKDKFVNLEYLSPISHLTQSAFNTIVRSEGYKDICINLIKLFDPHIEDLVYLKNEMTDRAVEYVKSDKLGLMPLSSYGDGIKKVLSLANGIIAAKDGILLIDEIDTSIHSKYYLDIFNFLIKACRLFNVQVFITTHSQEAIDGFLETQNYQGEAPERDNLNFITFRKDDDGIIRTRSMSGFDVRKNRELFNFEVRL